MLNINCPRCNSKKIRKAGFTQSKQNKKQRYECKNCGAFFDEESNTRLRKSDEESNIRPRKSTAKPIKPFCFDDDVWDIRSLGWTWDGLDLYAISFSAIKQSWFKNLVKQYTRQEIITGTTIGTVKYRIYALIKLSVYLYLYHSNIVSFDQITRKILLNFCSQELVNLKPNTYICYLSALRKFIESGNLNSWFTVSGNIIIEDDYPESKKGKPKDIPKIVLEQIEKNLHKIPEPFARMWIIGFFCGMRISELVLCPLDCIKQDTRGDWCIIFWRKKGKEDHVLPISREIAKIIQEQQQYIRQHLGDSFNYLFCGRASGHTDGTFKPINKLAQTAPLANAINRLIEEEDIRDENGKLWNFTSHQLRHTRATYLFETGHEFAVVSSWLGHKGFQTTQKYVNVKDHTLRDETAKVQMKLTNIRGEAVDWDKLPKTLQETPNAHTLAIPGDHINTPIYGYCGLPQNEECIQWKACYTCPSFIARREQLPDYIKIRDELRGKQARAAQNGETVSFDQFQQQADSLDAIVVSFG